MIENFEPLSVRNDLTNKLNSMKKKAKWYQKMKELFIDPCLPKLRIKPSAISKFKNSQFKELN